MTSHYNPIEPEHLFVEERSKADEILRQQNRSAPRPFPEERLSQYEKRLTDEVRKIAPSFKDVNLYEASGTAFNFLKSQVYEDAQREALRPTQIPDGELREVKRYDQSGRVSYEYFGKPSTWMNQFSNGRKFLRGIGTETDRTYSPVNVRSISGLKD